MLPLLVYLCSKEAQSNYINALVRKFYLTNISKTNRDILLEATFKNCKIVNCVQIEGESWLTFDDSIRLQQTLKNEKI